MVGVFEESRPERQVCHAGPRAFGCLGRTLTMIAPPPREAFRRALLSAAAASACSSRRPAATPDTSISLTLSRDSGMSSSSLRSCHRT